MAKEWPKYDRVVTEPTPKHKYFRVMLTTKAPNGKQVMAKATGKTKDAAHASAYYKLRKKIGPTLGRGS